MQHIVEHFVEAEKKHQQKKQRMDITAQQAGTHITYHSFLLRE